MSPKLSRCRIKIKFSKEFSCIEVSIQKIIQKKAPELVLHLSRVSRLICTQWRQKTVYSFDLLFLQIFDRFLWSMDSYIISRAPNNWGILNMTSYMCTVDSFYSLYVGEILANSCHIILAWNKISQWYWYYFDPTFWMQNLFATDISKN